MPNPSKKTQKTPPCPPRPSLACFHCILVVVESFNYTPTHDQRFHPQLTLHMPLRTCFSSPMLNPSNPPRSTRPHSAHSRQFCLLAPLDPGPLSTFLIILTEPRSFCPSLERLRPDHSLLTTCRFRTHPSPMHSQLRRTLQCSPPTLSWPLK